MPQKEINFHSSKTLLIYGLINFHSFEYTDDLGFGDRESAGNLCGNPACLPLACLVLLLQFLVAGLCSALCDGSCIQGLRSWSCCWCCNCGYWTSFWYCQGRQQNSLCLCLFFFLSCCSFSSSGNAFVFSCSQFHSVSIAHSSSVVT